MPRLLPSDEHWSKLRERLLHKAIYSKRDLRMTVEGMLYRMRTGWSWRDLPKAFGNWNKVYKRFNAWSAAGKWFKVFKVLVAEPDMEWVFIDGRYAKTHQHSAGASSANDEAIGKSRAGSTRKIHLTMDAHGLPIEFEITGGQINDCTQAPALISKLPATQTTVADKGYDGERIREQVERQGAKALIPRKRCERQHGSGQRLVSQSALGGKRLRPTEALPGGGLSFRQAQQKSRERSGHGLCLPMVAHVKRQQALG